MTRTDWRRDRRRHLGVDGYRSLRTRKICLHVRARVRTRPAATLAETQTVAAPRGVAAEMQELIDGLDFDIRALGLADVRRAAAAYAQWGKGVHPAGLNLADCFAYALAQQQDCPLLFVGNDFARTSALSSPPEPAPFGLAARSLT